MRNIVVGLIVSLFLSGAAAAQDSDIRATIGAQIEAFKSDDFAGAFTYASPSIQGLFQTPDNFGAMVRRGYPMVWRPSDVRFLELREVGGLFLQRVMVTDAGGVVHVLDYQMIQQENGWKINGVQLLKAPGANA
jgi:hypothetical protein